jgi:calcineurin-like phosphoesterase family protein
MASKSMEHRGRRGILAGALALSLLAGAGRASAVEQAAVNGPVVTGYVFRDDNGNGALDWGEPGLKNVAVSNGKEVVLTDKKGRYTLPAYDEMVVFVSKPAGYATPVNAENVPQFFYVHQPAGSPPEIVKYPGLAPTGPLPASVNFPLYKDRNPKKFKAIINGDMQPYNDTELSYLRDSFVSEAAAEEGEFVLALGDNVGDDLSLYPRLLSVTKQIGRPIYLVPGNHDRDYDSPDDAHAYDTFKRVYGPDYYSFDYGEVHFVVMDSIEHYLNAQGKGAYDGGIDAKQLQWLANDLAFVPEGRLVVLALHIPITGFKDPANITALYDIVKGRKVVAIAGHTHTIEYYLPGEEKPAGVPTPFTQIIAGAACGAWWSGDFDETGVPVSYQSDGAVCGYYRFEFNGTSFTESFKATGKPSSKQMNLSFLQSSFTNWWDQIVSWITAPRSSRPPTPPVTYKDLPDRGVVPSAELGTAQLVVNVWNGSTASNVACQFDDSAPVRAQQRMDLGDPYANRLQGYLFRTGLPGSYRVTSSRHLWTCSVPSGLLPGSHRVTVSEQDLFGQIHNETKAFEVAP